MATKIGKYTVQSHVSLHKGGKQPKQPKGIVTGAYSAQTFKPSMLGPSKRDKGAGK
jgi:hypothetical protein